MNNKIISIDGGDFTGKTTTIEELKKYITLERCPDPGYTEIGNKVRTMIKTTSVDNDVIKLLITAAEVSIFKHIKEQPQENKYFVLDHFWMAGVINQCIIPFCDKNNLDIFNFTEWELQRHKDLYFEIIEFMLVKIVSPQLEIVNHCFVFYATSMEILTPRITRELDMMEKAGVDRLNEGYKLFSEVMIPAMLKFKAIKASKHFNIFTEVYKMLQSVRPIIIDNKTPTQLAEEIMKILGEE